MGKSFSLKSSSNDPSPAPFLKTANLKSAVKALFIVISTFEPS